jgi:hypothetical protein
MQSLLIPFFVKQILYPEIARKNEQKQGSQQARREK